MDTRAERFRQADRALWTHAGLEPTERFLEVASPRLRLRLLEVGSGEPLLFVHGTEGPGGWPSLVRKLPGFRCLILERPGWGLSSPVDYSKHDYGSLSAEVMRGVLDGLGIDKVDVVGNSIGNVWALRLAERDPSRVGRVVLLGGGPLVRDVRVPGIIRLLASPIGALMARLPDSPGRVRSILRGGGHGASLDAGRLDDFIEWRSALGRHTMSMRHERAMIRDVAGGGEWRRGLTFEDAELASIRQPTLHVYGRADEVGSEAIWRRVTGLMPRGRLEVLGDAGHDPWFEDPGRVASLIRGFLAGELDPAAQDAST